jgi:probable rRNA maturation factor
MVILERKVAGLTEGSLARFLLRARKAAGMQEAVNVLVTGNASMRELNSRFRKKNIPTDVLSFPHKSLTNGAQNGNRLAGEVAISADIAAQNAIRLGHAVADEVKVLVLHGILHLAGFDHERDNGEMARKETELRRALKLPTALTERGQSGPRASDNNQMSQSRTKGARKKE